MIVERLLVCVYIRVIDERVLHVYLRVIVERLLHVYLRMIFKRSFNVAESVHFVAGHVSLPLYMSSCLALLSRTSLGCISRPSPNS